MATATTTRPGSRSTEALVRELRRALAHAGDPARAAGAQAYMKTREAFHGCSAPVTRATCKKIFARWPVDDATRWRGDVLGIWHAARFREERYAAIELAHDRRARAFQTMDALPMYEEMIVAGAWWDLVDPIATHLLGRILAVDPKPMRAAMLRWSKGEDMWKRRASIICQVSRKKETDIELLLACIEPSLERKEFWLRKAIGWALRSHAYTDSDAVVRYVRANEARLSGLSVREALKNVTSRRGTRPGSRARRPGPSS